MTNITNMADIISIADRAAAASDRWLFIATLIVLGAFALYILRRQQIQNENQVVQMREDHIEYKRTLMELNEKSAVRAEKYTQIIAENTFVSNQTNLVLNKINEKLNGLKLT